jgi:hypothetical protein
MSGQKREYPVIKLVRNSTGLPSKSVVLNMRLASRQHFENYWRVNVSDDNIQSGLLWVYPKTQQRDKWKQSSTKTVN